MKTKIFHIVENDNLDQLNEAVTLLENDEVVAFPTETVYGLGASIDSEEAIDKIFKAKGRPNDNPLIVHISSLEMLDSLTDNFNYKAKKLAEAFWPGPITLIVEKKDKVSNKVSAGLSTIGIRMPNNKIALELIKRLKTPIAAPSANLSGKPSITDPKYLIEDLDKKVAGLILSDNSEIGIESTVINMSTPTPIILRPGYITKEDIEKVIGPVELSKGITTGENPEKPASPGMKYKHYSPNAQVILVGGSKEETRSKILNYIENNNKNIKVLLSRNSKEDYPEYLNVESLGNSVEEFSKNIYSALRQADKENIDILLIESLEIKDRTLAVIDRLLHASNYTVI